MIARYTFDQGYSDSRNPLSEGTATSAEGSFGMLRLGEGLNRPFQGFATKGTSTGMGQMMPLGNTWGGLKGVSAQGSVLEDYNKQLYYIGATGNPAREGITLRVAGTTFTYDATTDVSGATITENSHGMSSGDPVYLTVSSGAINPELTAGRVYYVYTNNVNTFSLCTTYNNAIAGTTITLTDATGVITVTKGTALSVGQALRVASNPVSDTAGLAVMYQDDDAVGIARPDAPVLEVPTSVGNNYSGLIDGSISFKIAAFRDRDNEGVNLTTIQAPAKSVASATSAVVTPGRKTVKITFPSAATNQTHWAVFATKVGFGGVGVHYRVGYRTQSVDNNSDWLYGISETTVAAATNRTLEFDFRDSDLYPEEAWIYDYAPPNGEFFVQIDAVGVVLGCYDGSVGAVSMPNFKDSYNPRHLIYFPEPVTAVLQRQMGEYALVACRNSIHTLQYTGFRGDDTPSAITTTFVPDVGIKKPSNWAYGAQMICAWIDGAGLATINGQGEIDYEFGREVAQFTSAWTSDNVKIAFDPKTRSFIAAHQGQWVSYCVQTGAWSNPCYLTDYGFGSSVTIQSATAAQGELVMTLNDGGTLTAYSYDSNSNTLRVPVCEIGRWERMDSGGRSNGIYEIAVSARGTGTAVAPFTINATSDVDDGTEEITRASHGLQTGDRVVLTVATGAMIGGVTAGAPYYVVRTGANTFKLATTLANAVAGTPLVNLTDAVGTVTVTPVAEPLVIGLHANLFPTYLRGVTVNGANLTVSSTTFDSRWTGRQAAIFGTGVGGQGTNYVFAKLTYSNGTTLTLAHPTTGSALNLPSTSDCFALIGEDFFAETPELEHEQHYFNVYPNLQDARSFCVSVYMPCLKGGESVIRGAVFEADVFGTMSNTSEIRK